MARHDHADPGRRRMPRRPGVRKLTVPALVLFALAGSVGVSYLLSTRPPEQTVQARMLHAPTPSPGPSPGGPPGAATPTASPDPAMVVTTPTASRHRAMVETRGHPANRVQRQRTRVLARKAQRQAAHVAAQEQARRARQRGARIRARAKARRAAVTRFRISTLNVLGASHTAPGGDQSQWASGSTRMRWAVSLLHGARVDMIGFQELQGPQYRAFTAATGGGYGVFPGLSMGAKPLQNSLAWRRDRWKAVETHTIGIPYFHGHVVAMPYVLLRNRTTGKMVWFVNVHNPADKFGRAQRWRDLGIAREAALVRHLHADGTPVMLTGDLNDRDRAFCAIATHAAMASANGGSVVGGCHPPPRPTPVDWIFGTPGVTFAGYHRVDHGLVRRTTDHPFVWAEVSIAP